MAGGVTDLLLISQDSPLVSAPDVAASFSDYHLQNCYSYKFLCNMRGFIHHSTIEIIEIQCIVFSFIALLAASITQYNNWILN